jgi:hypothetical protein
MPSLACPAAAGDNRPSKHSLQELPLARPTPWSDKILALLRAGNPAAAIAQIRVAPSVRDLRSLETALAAAQLAGRWKDVDAAIADSIQALSGPRLHRSP